MRVKIRRRLCESIDAIIVFVNEAAGEDMIPRLQADEIINALLEARHATTAQPAKEPVVEMAV